MKNATDASGGHGAFSIPSLDGLRAISFFIVFLGHVGVPGIPGGFGVTVFFFLSGYLITTLLRLEVNKTKKLSFKLFYIRRALRIWPPFYIILGVASGLTALGFLKGRIGAVDLLAQCLHYSNYWLIYRGGDFIAPGTGVYWSLAVEEHFYLILPALYLVLRRLQLSARRQAMVFLALCAVTLLWRVVLVVLLHSQTERTYLATDTRFDSMLFGCCLAVWSNPALDLPKRARPSTAELSLLAGGVCLLLSSFVIRDPVFRETLRYTLQGIGLFPIFVTAVRYPSWGPYPFLQLRWVRYVGTISFTLYLVHQAVIIALNDHGLYYRPIVLPIALGISLAIASALWFAVEKPCAGLRRRFTSVGDRAAKAHASPAAIEPAPMPASADIGPS
ncbi:MAG TPA: acyltransferase [Polyangiaceae bacterium]|nr:acyltransferase [Polyangiaceae bacterium]